MEKVFEAFKRVKNFLGYNYCSVDLPNELRLIEQALTELKAIKEAKPNEAMDKLEGLGFGLWNEDKSIISINAHYFKNAYDTIKQALLKAQEQENELAEYKEALRIIFEKNIDIDIIKNCQTVIEYNWNTRFERYQCKELTEEEFNTVKRWQNG